MPMIYPGSRSSYERSDEGSKPEKSEESFLADEAAELRLIENDPEAAKLYDANQNAIHDRIRFVRELMELSPDKATFLTSLKERLPGHQQEREQRQQNKTRIAELQAAVDEAQKREINTGWDWHSYARMHKEKFRGSKKTAKKDLEEAERNEDKRQERLRALREEIQGSDEKSEKV